MAEVNATELAGRLAVSKARISQYVTEGKLEGCYSGEGRARRFDLAKVASALGKRLDLGQMTGNGLTTRRALRDLDGEEEPLRPVRRVEGGELAPRDPDRLELATILIKEEEARRRRRDNERDEGRWVLAEEVQRQTAQAMAREIAQFEVVIRDGARSIADQFGVDYRAVRRVLMEAWRAHRGRRQGEIAAEAEGAAMAAAEQEADV